MGWQDSLAKHHPITAIFAAAISNLFTSNKAEEDPNPTNTNSYNEPSSSDDYTYSPYGPSDIQPARYYYPPTPIPSSSSLNKPKKNKNKAYSEGRQIDHYNAINNNEQIVKPNKFFWRRKHELVVEQGKGIGRKGTVRREYVDQNGEEVAEERDYQFQSYYELQLSPAKVVEPRRNKGDYQGARRSRYYEY